jgi:ATP-dependent DNA helicase RecG
MTGAGSQPSFFDSTAFVDAQPVTHATRADLDLDLVAQHIAHARDQVPRFDAPADPVAFLRARRCLVDDTPTLAGLLVFGRRPQVVVPYAGLALTHFYDAAVSTQVRHSDTLEGPLSDIIRRAEEYLWEHTQHGFDTSAGPQRRRVDQYPRSVLRELTVNAVCHRDYSRTSRIRLQVFADRIEWVSPGSLPAPVTVDNILFEQATRNPTIVRLLYEAGFIEERGLGLDTVFRALEAQGLPAPLLLDTGGSFMVTVQGRQNIATQGDTRDLNEVQLKLLALLSSQGSFTIAEGELLFPHRSRRMLNRDIRGLLERQLITRTGQTNNIRYFPAASGGNG